MDCFVGIWKRPCLISAEGWNVSFESSIKPKLKVKQGVRQDNNIPHNGNARKNHCWMLQTSRWNPASLSIQNSKAGIRNTACWDLLVCFVLHKCGRKMLAITTKHPDIYMLLLWCSVHFSIHFTSLFSSIFSILVFISCVPHSIYCDSLQCHPFAAARPCQPMAQRPSFSTPSSSSWTWSR